MDLSDEALKRLLESGHSKGVEAPLIHELRQTRLQVAAYEKRIPELCKDYITKLDAANLQLSEAKEENVNLREAIREELEKSGVLSQWLVEEGDKLKETNRQFGELQKFLQRVTVAYCSRACASDGGNGNVILNHTDLCIGAAIALKDSLVQKRKDYSPNVCCEQCGKPEGSAAVLCPKCCERI